MHILSPETDNFPSWISGRERMLPTSAGIEPATSWSPVGWRIQLSHRGRQLLLWQHLRFVEAWWRWHSVLRPIQHYLSHIQTIKVCNEVQYSYELNFASNEIWTQDLMIKVKSDTSITAQSSGNFVCCSLSVWMLRLNNFHHSPFGRSKFQISWKLGW